MSNITVTIPEERYKQLLTMEKCVLNSGTYSACVTSNSSYYNVQYFFYTDDEVISKMAAENSQLKEEIFKLKNPRPVKKWWQL